MMHNTLLWTALASIVAMPAFAVDMALYEPATTVDSGFQSFVQQLYAETEDPASTTTFTDFFTSNGSLIVLGNKATGADKIVALKQALMPTDGTKLWNHVPNVTTVVADTDAEKTYEVLGVIQTTFTGGNCSQAYYSTRFTVAKNGDGSVNLATRSGSLILYDDYIVSPAKAPTDIPCQSI
ncbi:hypothetical protein N0V82_005338 [Gnomoniopsis sp. IMI 355080]|nr:hypothetical protein N0V82_005338 [Gnomoniopsis sp. IMI 355080]